MPVGAACTKDMFRCNNGVCLNRTRICDFTKDCADGEDEALDCGMLQEIKSHIFFFPILIIFLKNFYVSYMYIFERVVVLNPICKHM